MKWPLVKLGNLVEILGGGTPSRKVAEYWNGDIPWASIKDLSVSCIDSTLESITEEGLTSSAANLIPAGNIILATRVGLGKVAINKIDVAINQDLKALFCNDAVLPEFLFHYLSSYSKNISSQGVGATVKGLNLSQVNNWDIPLPPISEQRRIVEILDHADSLRKKRAEADAKAARILPALFYKMFGDPATNPKGWPIKALGELITKRPQYGANAKAIEFQKGSPRYVRITDITDDGRLGDSEIKTVDMVDWRDYELYEGDLLFARSGATVGKAYLYQPEDGLCVYAGYLIRFHFDRSKIDPWVAFAFTQTPHYKSWVTSKRRTAAQPNINAQEYASLQIFIPDKSVQNEFVIAAQGLRRLHSQREKAEQEVQKLFSNIIHRAFTGDLTAKWREAHMKELLEEMEQQAKALGLRKDNPA
jgi:type I restriction enzyme S subunit